MVGGLHIIHYGYSVYIFGYIFSSGQCQRPDCVKLCKEMRQNAIKQQVVEHDQLIHEFERLTTDPDGLLGMLEDTLQEYGDDVNFEAKRLLCALFQVQIEWI